MRAVPGCGGAAHVAQLAIATAILLAAPQAASALERVQAGDCVRGETADEDVGVSAHRVLSRDTPSEDSGVQEEIASDSPLATGGGADWSDMAAGAAMGAATMAFPPAAGYGVMLSAGELSNMLDPTGEITFGLTMAAVSSPVPGDELAMAGIWLGRYGGVCFAPGTGVDTEGGLVAIEEIGVGDLVWSYDPETDETALKEVVAVNERRAPFLVVLHVDRVAIRVTDEHPICGASGYVD